MTQTAPERIWAQATACENWDEPLATPRKVDHFVEYVRADLTNASPQSVKPLEWEKCDVYEFQAWTDFGTYCIDNNDRWWAFLVDECGDPFEAHATPEWTDDESAIDEMKTVCQRDYADRVGRQFSSPTPAPQSVSEAARELNDVARVLGLLAHDLTGRVEAGKLAALDKCRDRIRALIAQQEKEAEQ